MGQRFRGIGIKNIKLLQLIISVKKILIILERVNKKKKNQPRERKRERERKVPKVDSISI